MTYRPECAGLVIIDVDTATIGANPQFSAVVDHESPDPVVAQGCVVKGVAFEKRDFMPIEAI